MQCNTDGNHVLRPRLNLETYVLTLNSDLSTSLSRYRIVLLLWSKKWSTMRTNYLATLHPHPPGTYQLQNISWGWQIIGFLLIQITSTSATSSMPNVHLECWIENVKGPSYVKRFLPCRLYRFLKLMYFACLLYQFVLCFTFQ